MRPAETVSRATVTDMQPHPFDGRAVASCRRTSFHRSELQVAEVAVVAALRYGDNIMADWRVIGLYTTGDVNIPTPLDLTGNSARHDINITVDFANLPPQPF